MGYEKGWPEEVARSKMTQFIREDFNKKCLKLQQQARQPSTILLKWFEVRQLAKNLQKVNEWSVC